MQVNPALTAHGTPYCLRYAGKSSKKMFVSSSHNESFPCCMGTSLCDELPDVAVVLIGMHDMQQTNVSHAERNLKKVRCVHAICVKFFT